MKKDIALFLDNNDVDIDIVKCLHSNPGIGGTEWLFIKLYLSLKEKYKVYLFSTRQIKSGSMENNYIVKNYIEAVEQCDQLGIDYLILRGGATTIPSSKCNIILWMHNDLGYSYLRNITKLNNVYGVVFNSFSIMKRYFRNPQIRKKSFCCYNFIPDIRYKNNNVVCRTDVAYIGALIESKGVHLLTKCWDEVIKKSNQSKLHIFGSGQLYSKKNVLGKNNIASEEYENIILKPLYETNSIDKVIFHGTVYLDTEHDLLSSVGVGVINPSGKTETFCLSGIDFQRFGIPLVTLDCPVYNEIFPKKCSCKFDKTFDLPSAIIKCLNNKKYSQKLIKNGYKNLNRFSSKHIVKQWRNVLNNNHLFSELRLIDNVMKNKIFNN